MAQVFRLPRIGDSMAEVTVLEWHVNVGDSVKADQIVCAAETTKTVVEIPCPYAGTVLHLGGNVGDEIMLDEILIVVGEAGETWSPETARRDAAPAAATVAAGGPVKAIPRVRKLAQELGVDLARLTPTGANGTITEEDVKQAEARAATPGKTASTISVPHQRKRMTTLRKAIATNLLRSVNEVPHAAMAWDMDMTDIIVQRRAIIAEVGDKISMDAVIMSRAISLLPEFPAMNATIDGEDLIYYNEVNVGVAIGAEDGLVVPVIRNADRRSVKDLSDEVRRLAQAVREKRLKVEELSGMTCAISNMGSTGVTAGGMSINPLGIAFMLSICKVVQTPVVVDGEIVIRPIALFQITFDHRVVDGAYTAAFFRRLEEVITGRKQL